MYQLDKFDVMWPFRKKGGIVNLSKVVTENGTPVTYQIILDSQEINYEALLSAALYLIKQLAPEDTKQTTKDKDSVHNKAYT
jgi:hypothetical protein